MTEHLTDVDQLPSKELPAALRKFDEECQGWSEYGCGYGLELLIPAADEIERLQQALATANANHERFEREWYLRGDEIERLQRQVEELSIHAEKWVKRALGPAQVARCGHGNPIDPTGGYVCVRCFND